ncbi:uncharacterized protein F4807DRAFT_429917 [Annulohypoxylon truncatum]|uniref:uncharacterized protein n=1 Tax=Annulohypoxylon truncatum TaxID=327061 RepID=UPI002007AD51|nr:uncharacterized protein F4807DRAFT_429917 [Annulohypoxylon truncatum]KAI1208909.1 hypothetical protein F4807DRAFT_429917 [Annulohypoxylon truncatum]
MAQTSGASYRKDKKEFKELTDEKVRQIYVWRTEVEYSKTQCLCSGPSMVDPSFTRRAKSEGKGKGKAVARRGVQRTEASSSTAMDSDIQPEPHGTPPRDSPPQIGLFIPEEDPCPTCDSPVNAGVMFLKVGVKGERGIVCTNPSPRSTTSVNRLSDVLSYQQYKTPPKAWLKQKARKPLEQIKRAVTPENENSKRKQVLKPLLGLLRKSSTDSLSSGPPTVRPRATEMYHTVPSRDDLLRAGSVKTLLSGLSDDDDDGRGRPKLTIDESAARLRRAQRLLEKQNKNESKA